MNRTKADSPVEVGAPTVRPVGERPPLRLDMPVQFIPGVGPRVAAIYKRLGVETVSDLLWHLPHRYEHEHSERPIGEIGADQVVTARGEVGATRLAGMGRKMRFEANLIDPTGRLHLTWFNSPFLRHKIHPGMTLRVQGKTKKYGSYMQIVNPTWEVIGEDQPVEARSERYRPVYPATEDLSTERIDRTIQSILDEATALVPEHLPEAYRNDRSIPDLATALRLMHRPADEDDVRRARRRLALDELLLLQLGIALKRRQVKQHTDAAVLNTSGAIDEHIIARFPFTLTEHQRAVIDEIRRDLVQSTPMNRLLQGDVGSGKTVVALYAMLAAVASGHQAALMAPTEILAEQHYFTVTDMLKGSRVRIELLTAALAAAERRSLLDRLGAGEVDLVIGTHALLSKPVEFKRLAVLVIDEQHRFGVHQRAELRLRTAGSGGVAPHTLVMTATPIPRTLSLTLFGDLDVSTIKGLPPGRSPIITRVVTPGKAREVYEYVAKRIRDNREQAYIVLPAIDEAGGGGLKDVRSHLKLLEEGWFAGLRCAPIHGRLKRDTRERIMHRFRAGQIDALVATTVIEVGVDVPNASIMVVEHAERFGLSQLHQLRGRVGRGSTKSLCVFIGEPTTDDGKARLDAIASTGDGFIIAERDFEIRGMGEIFGPRQSGSTSLRVADLRTDMALLNMARRDARRWIEEDPTLSRAVNAPLRRRLMEQYGENLGIADVG
ncbi:MAG: ATP-dependent DNA helicase RecG [Phycisphaerales bacterium]|nr:ATP-dependent DNA helicase RecG [Phycisphaerales bacterium]